MTLAELQSWGKCLTCSVVLWTAPSIHEQRCSCLCGKCSIFNNTKSDPQDSWDEMFTGLEIQTELDAP